MNPESISEASSAFVSKMTCTSPKTEPNCSLPRARRSSILLIRPSPEQRTRASRMECGRHPRGSDSHRTRVRGTQTQGQGNRSNPFFPKIMHPKGEIWEPRRAFQDKHQSLPVLKSPGDIQFFL